MSSSAPISALVRVPPALERCPGALVQICLDSLDPVSLGRLEQCSKRFCDISRSEPHNRRRWERFTALLFIPRRLANERRLPTTVFFQVQPDGSRCMVSVQGDYLPEEELRAPVIMQLRSIHQFVGIHDWVLEKYRLEHYSDPQTPGDASLTRQLNRIQWVYAQARQKILALPPDALFQRALLVHAALPHLGWTQHLKVAVAVNSAVLLNVFENDWFQDLTCSVRNNFDFNFSSSFDHSKKKSFSACALPFFPRCWASNKALINFNVSRKRRTFINSTHVLPDFMPHSPCSFIGNSKLSLKLFSRYTTACSGKEIDSVKPELKRCA